MTDVSPSTPLASGRSRDSLLAYTLWCFVGTRLALCAIGLAAMGVLPFHDDMWRFVPRESLTGWNILDMWVRWDSLWYLRLARTGYADIGYHAVTRIDAAGFFPLYPLLVRYVGHVTGSPIVAGLLISNVAAVASLLLMGRLLSVDWPEPVVRRAVFFAAAFPTAFMWSAVATESLFFLLSVALFFFSRREQWWAAGAAGGLAALCRPVGVLLLVPLAWEYLESKERRFAAALSDPRGVALLVVPLGLAVYAAFCHQVYGDALAFVHRQTIWRGGFKWPWTPLIDVVKAPSIYNGSFLFLEPIVAIVFVGAIVHGYRRLRTSEWTYLTLSVLVPLTTSLESFSRYALVVFPFYIWLANLTGRPAADRVVTSLLLAQLGLYMALFTCGYWVV